MTFPRSPCWCQSQNINQPWISTNPISFPMLLFLSKAQIMSAYNGLYELTHLTGGGSEALEGWWQRQRWTSISWLPVQLFPHYDSPCPRLWQVVTWLPHSFKNWFNKYVLSSYQGPGTGDTAGWKQKMSLFSWSSHSTERINVYKTVHQMIVVKQAERAKRKDILF